MSTTSLKSFSYLLFLLLLINTNHLWAQTQTPLDIALRYIETNRLDWQLTKADIADLAITDMYTDKHNGKTHIYFVQRHKGIEIFNAVINIGVNKYGKASHIGHDLVANAAQKVQARKPQITPEQAVLRAAASMDIATPRQLAAPIQTDEHSYRFDKGSLSESDIKVKLYYQEGHDGLLYLVWNLNIKKISTLKKHMSIRINAESGEVFDSHNQFLFCTFDANPFHNHDAHCQDDNSSPALPQSIPVDEGLEKFNTTLMSASYRVYALPIESPLYGNRSLVVDPADPTASPYGWHDVDGVTGAEFTTTRGNNAYVFLDNQNTNRPDSIDTNNDGSFDDIFNVDGGMDLTFDNPINLDGSPADFNSAAVVNLFYAANKIHDIAYLFGFDEVSGNFQQNNYGNGGAENDAVRAEAQDEFDNGERNNAGFDPSVDGEESSLHMFLWDRDGGEPKLVNVTEPAAIAGRYNVSPAEWGLTIDQNTTVTAEVVIARDNAPNPSFTDACETLVNANELNGKIALLDRGFCQFGTKAFNAQQAGAVGVIVCNFEEGFTNMGPGALGAQVNIPVVMMTASNCALLRTYAGNGLEITMEPPADEGPEFVDGDFDNGIIIHEYSHGISNRLTGGPANEFCLRNPGDDGEQMGEGWSDFFALVATVKPGDNGAMPRGIGNYVLRQSTSGRGIRPFPYTTDMNINPDTYEDIALRSVPHGVGSVWCSMIWDMYWAFSDKYGWSADFADKTAGNNMAVQLVMDGMKNQPCSPGFVQGRSAILQADIDNYNGANQCLIWEVFARRGLGFGADQGSSFSAAGGKEDFNLFPSCVKELKIAKTMTPIIEAGGQITVNVTITNHKDEVVTNVLVADEIPEHTTFVNGSVSGGYTATTVGGMLSVELSDMAPQQIITFSYLLETSPTRFSLKQFANPAEDDSSWFARAIGELGNLPPNVWELIDTDVFEGQRAWHVNNHQDLSVQHLIHIDPILVQGRKPVLRFVHKYDTEAGYDGGFVEITTNDEPIDGSVYESVGDNIFRIPYDGIISYRAFAIPDLRTFWGRSNGWVESFVDLSDYKDQSIFFRFNFGTDGDVDDPGVTYDGWTVDKIEIMDMINYEGEACVTADNADQACAMAPGRGTIVESREGTPVSNPLQSAIQINVFPNPTDDLLNINIVSDRNEAASLSLLTLDGREINMRSISTATTAQTLSMDVKGVAAGFYFVKVTTSRGTVIEKVIIR